MGRSNKAKPPVVESCTMLMETMKISDASYCVTNIITPRRAATLAGVTSLEFWNDEKEMTEEDFYEENDDLKADLQKMSQSLKRILIVERDKAENRDDQWSDEEDDKKDVEKAKEDSYNDDVETP